MSDIDMGKWSPVWFHTFCTGEEIERIRNPKNAKDFLLRKRADIVADHIRFERVYMNKALVSEDWSFEKSFIDVHYKAVLKRLSEKDRVICDEITYGDMFSDDVNGYAWKNKDWGRIISLNESLQFFMKFCNLALFELKEDVPPHVRINAMRIAIRVFLKQEAMDFFMDPRGIVPSDIGAEIHMTLPYELQFIAGHEFAHHLCGHLDDRNICERTMLTVGGRSYTEPIYSVKQKEEFEADLESLRRPEYEREEYEHVLEGALIWFLSLQLSETAKNIIAPTSPYAVKTHPSAEARFEYILKNAEIPKDFDMDKIKRLKETANIMCKVLEEDLANNYDLYDMYGSCYLDAPNTKWRGRELKDRVDYY